MLFNFESPAQIIFGAGTIAQLPKHVKTMGSNCLLLTSTSTDRHLTTIEQLTNADITVHTFCIDGEPSIDLIDSATNCARQCNADVIVGVGGGSVLDAAKAVSIMAVNPGSVLEYLEVIGEGKPFLNPSLHCITVPTTAGTGAEVTKNAVLYSKENSIKVSMRSERMLPDVAIVDPELTLTVPQHVTASTGMDALTQVIEPFLSCLSNEFTDSLCREAITKAGPALLKVFHEPSDIAARTEMSYVSLMGGLALANAKLGAVHGFAGPIGGMFNAPHGAICAALLPYVLDANIKAIEKRGTGDHKKRYDELALLLTRNPMADAEDSVIYLKKMATSMNIPSLSTFGISATDIDTIIEASKNTSSMKGNTIPLTEDEMSSLLFKAL